MVYTVNQCKSLYLLNTALKVIASILVQTQHQISVRTKPHLLTSALKSFWHKVGVSMMPILGTSGRDTACVSMVSWNTS